jgi:uncharacterized protein Yka (UPF0111/DUF47 family)
LAEEYYDYEMERRRKQSLAEESLIEQVVGISRELSAMFRKLTAVVNSLASGGMEELKKLHSEIKNSKDRVETMKDEALTYLARLGDILPTSTIFKDLFLYLVNVAQSLEGIAYRAYLFSTNSRLESGAVKEKLKAITEALVREYDSLERAISNLWSNPKKSHESAQLVLGLENDIDTLYRELSYSLYRELKSDIVALMLIKDVADLMEDVADTIRDAAENVKFLALHLIAGR